MQVPPVAGKDWNVPPASPADSWLRHLSRVSYIRGHISMYAVGSVLLLAVNLLLGSGGVWADTAIVAWGVLVVAHGLIAVIARLLQELLAEEAEVRPASEMRWNAPSTWAMSPRLRENHSPSPTTGNEMSPAAPAPGSPVPPEAPSTATDTPARPADTGAAADTERVSWQKATDAAWLASPDTDRETDASSSGKNDKDDKNDFTPLKLD